MSRITTITAPPFIRGWETIAETTLSGTATSISFASIDTAAWTSFRLHAMVIPTASLTPWLRLNNDSAGNYDEQSVDIDSVNMTGLAEAAEAQVVLTPAGVANDYVSIDIEVIKDVATELGHVHVITCFDGGAPAVRLYRAYAQWNNTADLIDRIDIIASTSTFAIGTRILLEGHQLQ